jgi:hypothetical protein
MQDAPLRVAALPSSSSSKGLVARATETRIELPTGQLMETWNDEIFNLPFSIKNPEKAMVYLMYSSPIVTMRGSPKINVAMKLMDNKYGFYVEFEKVSCII